MYGFLSRPSGASGVSSGVNAVLAWRHRIGRPEPRRRQPGGVPRPLRLGIHYTYSGLIDRALSDLHPCQPCCLMQSAFDFLTWSRPSGT
jgi:hypothetical protein